MKKLLSLLALVTCLSAFGQTIYVGGEVVVDEAKLSAYLQINFNLTIA